jgi:hypothetical protein
MGLSTTIKCAFDLQLYDSKPKPKPAPTQSPNLNNLPTNAYLGVRFNIRPKRATTIYPEPISEPDTMNDFHGKFHNTISFHHTVLLSCPSPLPRSLTYSC